MNTTSPRRDHLAELLKRRPETETYCYALALLAGYVFQYLRRRARSKLSSKSSW